MTREVENIANNETNKYDKTLFSEQNIKSLIAQPDVQAVFRNHIFVPNSVMLKKVNNPFTDEKTKITTQKVKGISGTTFEDMIEVEFTLYGTEIDPVKSINKVYRLVDYTFALVANMSGGKFGGYSTTGVKLIVTKIEEIAKGK